jgi:hypothetical protein
VDFQIHLWKANTPTGRGRGTDLRMTINKGEYRQFFTLFTEE